MPKARSFYLSGLLDSRISGCGSPFVGTVKDLVASNGEHPGITACVVKTRDRELRTYDWKHFHIEKKNRSYAIICDGLDEMEPDQESIYLRKQILDKQIVDIDGKKVVRVNDVRLAEVPGGVFVVAVDVGIEGLLRRLGIATFSKKAVGLFGGTVPSDFILWNNIEAIGKSLQNIKLSMESSKLSRLHPSELADIIEDLDVNTRTAIFDALDNEKAADVLEELESDVQVSLLNQLPVEKAADVLEMMPADEVADILDDLREEKAEELLKEMEQEASEEVRELLEYEDDCVGSIMSTDFMTFRPAMTVNEGIIELRRLKPEADTIYSLYVVDEKEKLTGTVSLRDLVVSEPDTILEKIMNDKTVHVTDLDKLSSVSDIMSKYSLLALPVVDKDMKMVGVVIIDDVVFELMKAKRKRTI